MAHFFIITLTIFAVMLISANAFINCCYGDKECINACIQAHCKYMLCCSSNSCTFGNLTIFGCQCTCANCQNAALVASGLLETKFAPAKLIGNEAIKIAKI